MSKVVVVRYSGRSSDTGMILKEYAAMLATGLRALCGEKDLTRAVRRLLPSGPVGMKTNCLTGRTNSTAPALTEAMGNILMDTGFAENDLVIWERTGRELAGAGYVLNASSFGRRCLGTDTTGIGYADDFFSSGEVNSRVTRILTDLVNANINMPVLKDHSIAGLSGGLKNMYGAINNPNKYHADNCDPFCAHVSNLEPIRTRNRLTILDAARVQYNGGPGYVAEFGVNYGGVVISDDPVAADRVGLEILEHLRARHGLPPLEKVGRKVKYLQTAEQLGLGLADLQRIEVTVISVDGQGGERAGELF
jgi:uncharacterized protein (DUF362 family)